MLHVNVVNITKICTIKYGSYLLRRTRQLFDQKNIILSLQLISFGNPKVKEASWRTYRHLILEDRHG